MKVLLVAPPKAGVLDSAEYPPVGLGYIANTLREMGHQPEIQDCVINHWNADQLLGYVDQSKPDVVGITVFSMTLTATNKILEGIKAKNPDIVTLVGGPHPTSTPGKTLLQMPHADYAVNGEGELPLEHLMPFLENGHRGDPENIPGLIWRTKDGVKFNPKVEAPNVDDYVPAWDLIDPTRYYSGKVNITDRSGVIHTGRGCPFLCTFCVTLGRKLRQRSLDKVYEEITYLNKNYGINRFYIGDEGFPINKNYTKAFCRYVIEKGDNFTYLAATGLRLDVLDDEMVQLLKEANFERQFGVGIESGVQRVRDLMKKSLKQEGMYRGIELLNKYGFRPSGNFIIGFPGETREEIEETIRVALKMDLWGASFTPFIPLPGADATNALIESGELDEDFDWEKIDLDAVLYGTDGLSTKEINRLRRKAVFLFNIRPRILWYHLNPKRIAWSISKFLKIFFPSWILPKNWRFNLLDNKKSLQKTEIRDHGVTAPKLGGC